MEIICLIGRGITICFSHLHGALSFVVRGTTANTERIREMKMFWDWAHGFLRIFALCT